MKKVYEMRHIHKTDDRLIRQIEDILERAKRGELYAFGIAYCGRKCISTQWYSRTNYSELLGAIRMLEHDIIKNQMD
jgi:hypothetical protein